jgi:predicted transcriptional regulator of viral defense system
MSTAAGIGAKGRAELTTVLGAGRRFVTPTDVVAAIGVDADTAAKKLSRWAADGWLRRARRGLYIPVPVDASSPAAWSEDALIVAAAVWSSCYFTGWTAANHWALTEQVFRTIVLKTSERVRASSVRLLDHDYLLSHVAAEAMEWGTKTEWQGEVRLRFADPARTVVDSLDRPRLGGGIRHGAEILAAISTITTPRPSSSTATGWGTGPCSSDSATWSKHWSETRQSWSQPVASASWRASPCSTPTGRKTVGV